MLDLYPEAGGGLVDALVDLGPEGVGEGAVRDHHEPEVLALDAGAVWEFWLLRAVGGGGRQAERGHDRCGEHVGV